MLTDRYGLALSTTSAAARDDYVVATDRALTFYPGAAEAYDRAIAADPGFALSHVGKAQVLMRQGEIAAAWSALAAAKDVSAGQSEREASHISFFDLVFAGRPRWPPCTRTSRHGRVMLWWSPWPLTRMA
jgi:hypothetical protein